RSAVRTVENPLTARDGVLDQFDLLLRRTLHPIRKPSDLVCEDHRYTEALCDPLCSGRLSRSCGAVQQDAPRRRRIRISDAQALTYSARCLPVSVDLAFTSSAGVPSNTMRPPS